MSDKEVDEFARKLVKLVRDAAIRAADMKLRPEVRTAAARRWQAAGADGADSAARVVIADTVDETLFSLLSAVDQGVLRIQFTSESGETVDLSEAGLGELAGWYIGPDGWRDWYSGERYFPFVE